MGKRNQKNSKKKKSIKNTSHKGKHKVPQIDWEKYFKEYQEVLKSKGLQMIDVERDGNCLFRAIASNFEGNEKNYKVYREKAVEYLTEKKDYFQMFLLENEKMDDYLKRIKEDGVWGGHFELIALSDILKVQFCIHVKDQSPMFVKCDEIPSDAKVVHLAYHLGEHYNCMRKLGDVGELPTENIDIVDEENSNGQNHEAETIVQELDKMNFESDSIPASSEEKKD